MTYLLFVNSVYFKATRDISLAFAWRRDWESKGHKAGLRFVRDNDSEALKWLVPVTAMETVRRAA
jgi:hypothetical protein